MLQSPDEIPFRERLSCTVKDACERTGLGRTKFEEMMRLGAVETIKIGRRRLVLVRSLLKLIEGTGDRP